MYVRSIAVALAGGIALSLNTYLAPPRFTLDTTGAVHLTAIGHHVTSLYM